MEYVYLIVAMIAGTGTHVLKKVVERRKTDTTFTLKHWLTAYPYKTVLTLMAGAAGFLGLMGAGELTLLTAFMAGYMANSLGGTAE